MDEIKAVERANQEFYDALQQLSLNRMDQIWLHEDWVKCIHPGWELIEGWSDIRSSWENIFRNTQSMQIALTQVSVRREGELAIVVCTENISSHSPEGIRSALALATNLYVQRNGRWLMVHHHASPLPMDDSVLWSDTVQ